ncbi:MAG: PAS domain S-box protein [Bacteroidetes bacterium]|nr:PAS domain S-box protein [Bacteroidota bacterium]
MLTPRKISYFSVILFLLIPFSIFSQQKNLLFESISLENGLSHNAVYSITQDKSGFMWFATQDGLNKYDGHEITVFKFNPLDSFSLPNNNASKVFEDREGNIWVGTWGGGLCRFDPIHEDFVIYKYNPSNPSSISFNRVPVIFQSKNGDLWIGTAGGGLNRYIKQKDAFETYKHFEDDDNSLSNNRIWDIKEDNSGNLWIATDEGLNKFSISAKTFTRFMPNASSKRIRSILFTSQGEFFAGGETGLFQFNEAQKEFRQIPLSRKENEQDIVNYLFEDKAGKVWAGTYGNGLYVRDKEGFVNYVNNPNNPFSLRSNDVRCIFEDGSSTIWIGTRGNGISKYNPSTIKFNVLRNIPYDRNSLTSNSIRTILEDSQKNIWIGTNDGGLNFYDPVNNIFKSFATQPGRNTIKGYERITGIIEDSPGIFWLGTDDGLVKFNSKTLSYDLTKNEQISSTSSNSVILCLFKDADGDIWIGTYGVGLHRYNPATQSFQTFRNNPAAKNSLSNNEIWSICQDREGFLWLGTGDGLNKLDKKSGQFTVYKHSVSDNNTLSDNFVNYVTFDVSGNLWVGTNTGLNLFDRKTAQAKRFENIGELSGDVVYGILPDRKSNLWISTTKGLIKFNPQELTTKTFNVLDGLQSNVFTQNACYKASDGKMFFGGINGLNYFYPDSIPENKFIPNVVITDYKLIEQNVPERDLEKYWNMFKSEQKLVLPYDRNFITLDFASLDFARPEKNQYKYKLEGVDVEWISAGNRRNATYTSLNPGTYTFHVKGSNNDGVWNETGAVLKIQITPPFWKTWWFILGIAVLITASGYSAYNYRVNRLRSKQAELLNLINEREIAEAKVRKSEEEIRKINSFLEERIKERTAKLENEIVERKRYEKVQEAIYQIAEAIPVSEDMIELFSKIHGIISLLMPAKNFYIALYDKKNDFVTFPYYVDEYDYKPVARRAKKGITEFVVKTGKAILSPRSVSDELIRTGEIEQTGRPSPLWMGVPLKIKGETIGVMAIQDYHREDTYGENELQILMFVSEQISVAIERKTREENDKKNLEVILQHRNVLLALSQVDKSDFNLSLEKILAATAESLNIDRVSFWILDKEEMKLKCKKMYIRKTDTFDKSSESTTLPATFPGIADNFNDYYNALKSNKKLQSNDAQGDEKTGIVDNYLKPLGIKYIMDIPVWLRGDIYGIICLEETNEIKELSVAEEDFIASISTMLTLSLEASFRKKAEESLSASEEQYKVLVENASEAILVLQDGLIKYSNPRTYDLLGYTSEELHYSKFLNYIHDDDKGLALQNHLNKLKGIIESNVYTYRIITKRGLVRFFSVNAVLINWAGERAVLAFLSDVTERKRAEREIELSFEKQKELADLRSKFVTMASHEFKTPLTAILGSAEILEKYGETLPEDKRSRNIIRIQESVKRMNQMLNDIIIMGKSDTGKLEMKSAPIDLNSFLQNLIDDLLQREAKKAHPKLIVDISGLPVDANVDAEILRQAIENILSNAFKFSAPESEVTFNAHMQKNDIIIKVIDEGIGIPDSDKERLSEPFFKGSNVGNLSGTGLGLTIVKRAVSMHNGRLEITSTENVGTEVTIVFPYRVN